VLSIVKTTEALLLAVVSVILVKAPPLTAIWDKDVTEATVVLFKALDVNTPPVVTLFAIF
jgi:hypothetical protein